MAFQLLADVFGDQPFVPLSLTGLNENVTTIVFQRANHERIIVIWNNTRQPLQHTMQS